MNAVVEAQARSAPIPLGRLERIELRGYRSIKTMDLDLGPINVLIGPNGAGKSNFIGFFRFLNRMLIGELQLAVKDMGGADRVLHFGRKHTSNMSLRLQFDSRPDTYFFRLAPTVDDQLIFREEHATFSNEVLQHPSGGDIRHSLSKPGAEESALAFARRHSAFEGAKNWIAQWKVYHFHDTSGSAALKQAVEIADCDYLRPHADNLAAFLMWMRERHEGHYRKLVDTIRRVAPFFADFILEPDAYRPELVRLRWRHVGSEAYFDASMLSDGTLRFICLATLLLQPKLPTLILLDEPELGLHPFAVQLLAGMMRSASQHTQLIASTQSVTLANQFEWQALVVADLRDGASTFRRLKEAEVAAWLDEYRLGDLWEKNLIGGTPE